MEYTTEEVMRKIDNGELTLYSDPDTFHAGYIRDGNLVEFSDEVSYFNSYLYWYEQNREYWLENFSPWAHIIGPK